VGSASSLSDRALKPESQAKDTTHKPSLELPPLTGRCANNYFLILVSLRVAAPLREN
jgi:hypothetical protein